ncbi:conserved hypothetical protein [Ricinus communis]|uniref:Uncharacterized protein n=1 Tax=Ricinus communis TaxID=3988 RepID=B9SW81_RICCO|nr:conserved hypothetical protein [Ricinus communis]
MIIMRIVGIQQVLDNHTSNHLSALEESLNKELENTTFFYKKASHRYQISMREMSQYQHK